MRIAILSNVTVELLAGMLKKEHSVWIPSGFGAWMETALNPPAELREFAPMAIFIVLDRSHCAVADDAPGQAKSALENSFPASDVLPLDLEDLADEVGDGFLDERTWKIASMPWSLTGLNAIKNEICRLAEMISGGRKKVVAVDFDNTLWSGVIGEDGIEGIRHFTTFQNGLKSLRERGALIVGLSKNNAADVEPIWNDARMTLRKDDFAAMRIDWNDKPSNLSSIAKELNLGTDSFVFIDDNPAECMRMRAERAEVATLDFPADEQCHPRFIRRLERMYFPAMRLTDEDRARTALYRDEAARREFARGLSFDEYLKGLEIWFDVHRVREDEFARVAQLSQKSNQFNVLTNRYTVDDVAHFANDPKRLFVSVHAGDRFGDQGLVAFVQAAIEGDDAEIMDWVRSCRAMNRRLEYSIEERFENMLSGMGVKRIRAAWRRTAKNAPAERLFDDLGFGVMDRSEDAKRYAVPLPRSIPTAAAKDRTGANP